MSSDFVQYLILHTQQHSRVDTFMTCIVQMKNSEPERLDNSPNIKRSWSQPRQLGPELVTVHALPLEDPAPICPQVYSSGRFLEEASLFG